MALYQPKTISPAHEEDYDSDDMSIGDRRLSRIQDIKFRNALQIVRRSSECHLKEECLRNEWFASKEEDERLVLKDVISLPGFWDEVKDMAQRELQAVPSVMGEEQFREMFQEFDADGSGTIDIEELKQLLKVAMGMTCSDTEVKDLMKSVDTDGSGEIDESEFLEIMNAARQQQEASSMSASSREELIRGMNDFSNGGGRTMPPARPRSPNRPVTSPSKQLSADEYSDLMKQKAAAAQATIPTPGISISSPAVPQSAADKAEREKDMEDLKNLKKDHAKFVSDTASPTSASPETTVSGGLNFHTTSPGTASATGISPRGGYGGGASYGSPLSAGSAGPRNSTSSSPGTKPRSGSRIGGTPSYMRGTASSKKKK
eukprot:TRINITY_DN2197_c1_g1_i1.p1 TRINITY_DN2197_c1_g1~~TRINITY_DN2197_c1_g1_i1.p1  ORF type:complete len:404 (+),score=101.56 TRINITY_DN2197_c1_g1_i1:91-1212(+)